VEIKTFNATPLFWLPLRSSVTTEAWKGPRASYSHVLVGAPAGPRTWTHVIDDARSEAGAMSEVGNA